MYFEGYKILVIKMNNQLPFIKIKLTESSKNYHILNILGLVANSQTDDYITWNEEHNVNLL